MSGILILALLSPWLAVCQDTGFISIHQEQQAYYGKFSEKDAIFFDSLNGYTGRFTDSTCDTCHLEKLVFGFHPYWMGSAYINYRWNLLSDFCYFSYEVEPNTGEPATIHGWLSDASIDSAQAHGVRTHLCATLFSGHGAFFSNPTARQTLISNLIGLVDQRNADGINIDFEAVPNSLRDEVTSFMASLSEQFRAAYPGGFISMDLPAVDWGNVFDIPALNDHVDLFFIMGYDYYWNGSGTAGPVGPLYSMTGVYDYSLCRTISAYQAAGIPNEKFILGLPYYGRTWKTLSNAVPSGTIGYGTALTYTNVRNNGGGNYSPDNYFWEANSVSSCYIFYINSSWNQCFIGLSKDLLERYDVVRYRGLAGIGIWALGYDNGYSELWDAIRNKLSDCSLPLLSDTLYDCGGPAWNYYNNEDFFVDLQANPPGTRYLEFHSVRTENGFDSLWVFSGPDSSLVLLGALSGHPSPPAYSSPDGHFVLRFHSDALGTDSGWMAIWHDGTLGNLARSVHETGITAYPNPFRNRVFLTVEGMDVENISVACTDIYGREMGCHVAALDKISPDMARVAVDFLPGRLFGAKVCFIVIEKGREWIGAVKVVRVD